MEQQQISTKRLLSFKDITITSITWNLYGDLPPINSLVQLSKSQYFKTEPQIIFFGTQQCQRALWLTLCCEGKQNWQAMLRQVFPNYELKVSEVMRGIHSAVLVHRKISNDVELYRINRLKSGACGLMGTKGALSIQLLVKGDLIQLINCHLAANQEQSKQRNKTIAQVIEKMIQRNQNANIIFLGDFNYRIEMSKKQYELLLVNKTTNNETSMNYKSMLQKQQLRRQEDLKQQFLVKFQEGPINFPPTYKLGLYEDQYSNDRIPGWTDRIFHKTSKTLQRTSYGCLFSIKGCDHRPVLATFIKTLSGKEYRLAKQQTNKCQII